MMGGCRAWWVLHEVNMSSRTRCYSKVIQTLTRWRHVCWGSTRQEGEHSLCGYICWPPQNMLATVVLPQVKTAHLKINSNSQFKQIQHIIARIQKSVATWTWQVWSNCHVGFWFGYCQMWFIETFISVSLSGCANTKGQKGKLILSNE